VAELSTRLCKLFPVVAQMFRPDVVLKAIPPVNAGPASFPSVSIDVVMVRMADRIITD